MIIFEIIALSIVLAIIVYFGLPGLLTALAILIVWQVAYRIKTKRWMRSHPHSWHR